MHVLITDHLDSYGPDIYEHLKKGHVALCMRHDIETNPDTQQSISWYLVPCGKSRRAYMPSPSPDIKIAYRHPDLPEDYSKENLAWVSSHEAEPIESATNRQMSGILSADF